MPVTRRTRKDRWLDDGCVSPDAPVLMRQRHPGLAWSLVAAGVDVDFRKRSAPRHLVIRRPWFVLVRAGASLQLGNRANKLRVQRLVRCRYGDVTAFSATVSEPAIVSNAERTSGDVVSARNLTWPSTNTAIPPP